MNARVVMVLGCTSGAGKSWIATALCRWYARRGWRVRPFKAQNMSNHARVVDLGDGGVGEIGSAQYFQALAAQTTPDVRMNPVLLKPEADTRSQVIVMGRVRHDLADVPWRERSPLLWAEAHAALESLLADTDVLIIEGAGSPAEINLAADDYVNTRTALAANARCLLVADIDRGGAFAHLYGTHALMDARVRERVEGFVLNRFRGDASLLAPGPEQLRAMTGVSTLAVVPMVRGHGLPEEDGVPDPTPTPLAAFAQNLKYSANAFADLRGPGQVVVLATPHASNLDEFEPLRAAGVPCTFSADANALVKARLLILPGSKNTRADLEWLRAQQLDRMIYAHVNANKPLLAICGGLQLTGEWIKDEQGVEGGTIGGDAGLGLLPLVTVFERDKHLSRTHARFEKLAAPWDVWSDQRAHGYEIRHGRTAALGQARPALTNVQPVEDDATLGWQSGPVLAVYLHGLFENPNLIRTMLGLEPPGLDDVFERLADTLDASFEPGTLERLVNDRRSRPR